MTKKAHCQKGGLTTSADRKHMKAIGKKGGLKTAQNREHMKRISKLAAEARKRNRLARLKRAKQALLEET